jgi:hypothetical protein
MEEEARVKGLPKPKMLRKTEIEIAKLCSDIVFL